MLRNEKIGLEQSTEIGTYEKEVYKFHSKSTEILFLINTKIDLHVI